MIFFVVFLEFSIRRAPLDDISKFNSIRPFSFYSDNVLAHQTLSDYDDDVARHLYLLLSSFPFAIAIQNTAIGNKRYLFVTSLHTASEVYFFRS